MHKQIWIDARKTKTEIMEGREEQILAYCKRYFGEGIEDGGPGTKEEEHNEAIFTILSYLYTFSIADYVSWLKIFDFDGHRGMLKKAIENLTKYHDPEIDHRIQMWKSGSKANE
ncbi:unnamed protein product [Fraxinus pennsylvanica]|uniref:Uncharacterized protein n=1 Tax=Fraxinus pennsylvanica TaxID=56036 RepID=A0AAD2E950_9LAMI|nr:unnamed protein product [Fraxinus pennsylvanica]